jgi:hypothetical protein
MSSPPNHQKTRNEFYINEIKLSPKWFLVIVNPVQLKERSRKPRQPPGLFLSLTQATAGKSFVDRILAVSPMVAGF